ncbi:MAG: transcription-repair coupling factor [Bdellovibrionales bacterium]|nr:transcription-repair coupling factor [Bdellovibrionales bacterium]
MIASSSILSILRSSRELDESVRVTGLSRGARALLLARWGAEREGGAPLLVVCPSNELATELAEEIETLSETVLGRNVRAAAFPGWDHSPFSSIAPSIGVRLARIALLTRLAKGEDVPDLVLTSLPAALHRTLPLATLEARSFVLRKGEGVESRDVLARNLAEAGYLRVDPVEDRGTFAVRGDLVDVFPPEAARPYRLELWGDEVETIREFDPKTQRTLSEHSHAQIAFGPAREVLINSETVASVREGLKARADDAGISRALRDPLLERVHAGSYPESADFWSAFAYPGKARTLFEFLPWSRVAVIDALGAEQGWDAWVADQREREKEALESGVVLPKIEEEFDVRPSSLEKLPIAKRLFLDVLELADLSARPELPEAPEDGYTDEFSSEIGKPSDEPKARHRAFVKTNADLHDGKPPSLATLEPKFGLWRKQGFRTLILAPTPSQVERLRYLLEERKIPVTLGPEGNELAEPNAGSVTLREGSVAEGFRWPAEGLVVLTDSEILGTKSRHQSKKRRKQDESAAKEWSNLQATSDLAVGDAVVHIDHGIGRYQGIVRLDLNGASNDFLLLEYANKDKLYLPIYRLNVIQKYAGGSGEGAALDTLGTGHFAKAKEKAKESVRKIAIDLVKLYAERKIRPGLRFSPRDAEMNRFEASFPFDETPDQLRAIEATFDDMESGRVMDRLVCGDVGYGKTEVAIRAAFKAVYDGYQVAVLVPTTVLAHQHEQSFRARFGKDYPAIRLESVSRFKSAKEQKEIIKSVESGGVDIIIGTHRLLSKDVRFKRLGLVIIDEEHRFGVEHKERLKTFRTNTHVLTLTATPIPRTLHMSLSGLRDISLINTAPLNRLPIRTYVSKFDEDLIRRTIETELSRGGQVFFVHNRVGSIYSVAEKVKELVPRAQIGVGHGQMAEGELEKVMMDFYEKKTNVLVATTIIESGIDIPSANTILIDRADAFGLAQLYQLRGRVGRAQTRAYAYLFIPAEGVITEDAKKRLEVIQKFVELGSGFSVASHDLEIRGGGDILGPQQSGHINAVGFDLYTELLEEAIRELEGKPLEAEDSHREPEIKVPFSALLPEDYVADPQQRLALYRRLSGASQEEQIDEIEVELQDRFGKLPEAAKNLLWLIRVKRMLKMLKVDALTVGPERVVLSPGADSALDPIRAIALVSSHGEKYSLTPDSKFIARVKILSLQDLYHSVSTLLRELSFRD